MPNGYQDIANIDAQTYQKSMPKQVAKEFIEIITNHFSLSVKTCTLIVATIIVEGLAGCVRERKRYININKVH